MPAADDLRLGPYRTTALLLSGRGIDVYAAVRDDGEPGRDVTIARLAAASAEDVTAATEAARLAASDDLPHVAPLVEAFERAGVLHVVTRRSPGARLDALLAASADAPLPPSVAVSIVSTAAEALHACHQASPGQAQGVAPWFLRLTSSGETQVEHLGLPAVLRASLRSGSPLSSASYMTPEHARGITPDATSDVFALGTLLAHLLTGRAPFAGEEDAIVEAVLRGDVTPPTFLVGGLAQELDDVVARAVHAEPSERYPTADAFQRALLAAAYPTVGVATATDARSYLSTWSEQATAWERETPPQLEDGDAPTQLAAPPAVDVESDLDWGDDEETNVWRGDDDEVTVVVAREAMEVSGSRNSVADRARTEAQARGRRTDESGANSAPGVLKPPVAPQLEARPVPEPHAPTSGSFLGTTANAAATSEPTAPEAARVGDPLADRASVSPTGRPARQTASEARSPVLWIAVVGILAIAILAVLLRSGAPGGGSSPAFGSLELAVSPLDGAYEVLIDGIEVSSGTPPFTISDLAPGTRELTVRGSGVESRSEPIAILEGAPLQLTWELAALPEQPATPPEQAEAPADSIATTIVAGRERVTGAFDRAREAGVAEVERLEAEATAAEQAAAAERARQADRTAAASSRPARTARPQAAPAAPPARSSAGRPTPPEPVRVPQRPEPEPEATEPEATEPGLLNVQSVPAAQVWVDGEDTGRYTPIINMPLSPGRHRIQLRNPDFDLDRTYTITIESGRTRTVINRPQ